MRRFLLIKLRDFKNYSLPNKEILMIKTVCFFFRERTNVVLPSYMVDLQGLDTPVLNITDLVFLHGYQEPTVMILFEPVQTSSGFVIIMLFCYVYDDK